MRNLSGPGPATARGRRSQAPPSLTGVAAWPSVPSGAHHAGGTWLLIGGLVRCLLVVRLGPAAATVISHVIPQQLIQTLNLYRWNCNVFGRSRKVTVGNYVRNLSGGGPANLCWLCQPAAACTAAGSCGSSGAFRFTPVGPGVLLCWLARYLPRVRYKTLPARCFAEHSGTKLSLHA